MNQRGDVALHAKLAQNTHQGASRQEVEWNWSPLDCHNAIRVSKQASAPERDQGNERGQLDSNVWLFAGSSALRRCMQRCPLQRKAKEKTAEEGDLSYQRVRQSSPSNSAQAPGLIIGAEQSRARTKQVLCNQQLAVACDVPQSQPELSLHTNSHTHMSTFSRTRTLVPTQARSQKNTQKPCTQPHRHMFIHKHTNNTQWTVLIWSWRHNSLRFNLISPRPSISKSLSCSTPPYLRHHRLVCSPPSYSSLSFLCEIGSGCLRSREWGGNEGRREAC